MIGMSSSDRMKLIAMLLFPSSAGLLMADNISLTGDARLSGTVRSITGDGVVELVTPLAPEPILLKGDAVKKVTFSETAQAIKMPSSRIELINGDMLPVEVQSLDDKLLHVISPVAGKLDIPRGVLKSLQLGIHPNRVIFSGPRSLEDLRPEGPNADSANYEEGVITLEGPGRLVRKLDPVQQFIVRFNLEWHNTPSFTFTFADALTPSHQTADRYIFQFNAQGIEIRREASKGRHYTTIMPIFRRPDQYPGNRLKVEIRMDRANSKLHLFLNDESEGACTDPVPDPPTAGGISFTSNAGNESELNLSEVEVLEWDPTGDRHRTEDRGDPKADALIEKRGDRFGGKLISIKESPEGPLFSFKSDFRDEPIELPESEVSTIFFQQEDRLPEDVFHPFALRLRGDGMLRVSACSFPGERIEATHPLLGPLVFSRDGLLALERLEKKGGKP